jgi:hypothetical protein
MELFKLLYLFYAAKLACQAYTYIAWLAEPSTRAIIFSAATVAILSGVPLLHVIAHASSAAPLSTLPVIAYICLRHGALALETTYADRS